MELWITFRRGVQVIGAMVLVGQKDWCVLRSGSPAQGLVGLLGIANPSEVEKWQWEQYGREVDLAGGRGFHGMSGQVTAEET